MKKVLVINSSLQGENGNSNKASKRYLNALKVKGQSIEVTKLDLNAYGLPHLSGEEMQAWSIAEAQRTAEQKALAAHSELFIKQLFETDELVLAVPMYNFGIPSSLKAYFDRIARAGITFKYTDTGPQGQVKGKKATILAARGGKYAGTEMDTQAPYIKNFLEFIGFENINFLFIEGLAMGEASAEEAWNNFDKKISEPLI